MHLDTTYRQTTKIFSTYDTVIPGWRPFNWLSILAMTNDCDLQKAAFKFIGHECRPHKRIPRPSREMLMMMAAPPDQAQAIEDIKEWCKRRWGDDYSWAAPVWPQNDPVSTRLNLSRTETTLIHRLSSGFAFQPRKDTMTGTSRARTSRSAKRGESFSWIFLPDAVPDSNTLIRLVTSAGH